MTARILLGSAAWLAVVSCSRTAETSDANESRTDADTVSRSADSLMIGGSGVAPINAETPVTEQGGQVPSAALSDFSTSGNADTATATRPRPIPAEGAPSVKHD